MGGDWQTGRLWGVGSCGVCVAVGRGQLWGLRGCGAVCTAVGAQQRGCGAVCTAVGAQRGGASRLGEAVDVLLSEPVEQRCLADAVLADEAVAPAALEANVRLPQQHAPREREDGVLQVDGVVGAAQVGEHALLPLRHVLLEELHGRGRQRRA
eukprot:4311524-Prymnesium_polylepis.1